jgi:hypothetical protein
MKLQLKEQFKSDTLDFQNGEYRRDFKRSEQPFEADDEEGLILLRSGFFEPVKETPPPPPPQQEEEKQSQSKGDQQDAGSQPRVGKRAPNKH